MCFYKCLYRLFSRGRGPPFLPPLPQRPNLHHTKGETLLLSKSYQKGPFLSKNCAFWHLLFDRKNPIKKGCPDMHQFDICWLHICRWTFAAQTFWLGQEICRFIGVHTKDIHHFRPFLPPPLPLCPLSIHSRLNPVRRKSYSPRPPFLKIFWSIFFCNIFKKSFVLW